ncbi:sensor histidine kinase [Micromonosporaceae bacterium Da 78-11]
MCTAIPVITAVRSSSSLSATLDVELPERALVWGDRRRLTQVVDELLANAFAWVDAGRVTVKLTTGEASTQLSVSNTGRVIPAAERERLFDRFFRTSSAGRHAIPGTGLGLSLARTIVDQHGGTLVAGSDDDPPGTTLTVRLPTHPIPDTAEPAAASPDQFDPRPGEVVRAEPALPSTG